MFLHSNNKVSGKNDPVYNSIKNIFRNKLSQKVKDFYSENYKTLIKETEDDKVNGKVSLVHGLEQIVLLKWQYYQSHFWIQCCPYHNSIELFFTEVEKTTLPGFSVHVILQVRILEWIAILFSRGSS